MDPSGLSGFSLRDLLQNQGSSGLSADDLQAQLKLIQQYDPNASIMSQADLRAKQGFSPDSITDDMKNQQMIDFDATKMPKDAGGSNPFAYKSGENRDEVWDPRGDIEKSGVRSLSNPKDTWVDPLYGLMTHSANDNINDKLDDKLQTTTLDKVGPLVVGGIAGLGAFDPEMGFLGGGMDLGGSGSMGQFAGNLAQTGIKDLEKGSFNPMDVVSPALGAFGGAIPGFSSLTSGAGMPGLGDIFKYYNLARGAASNPVGTGVNYGLQQIMKYLRGS